MTINATSEATFIVLFSRGDWIRTSDLTHPKGALYQAEPRPDAVAKVLYPHFAEITPAILTS
jgi:hypothetical protein